jgi:hypothetical protein
MIQKQLLTFTHPVIAECCYSLISAFLEMPELTWCNNAQQYLPKRYYLLLPAPSAAAECRYANDAFVRQTSASRNAVVKPLSASGNQRVDCSLKGSS